MLVLEVMAKVEDLVPFQEVEGGWWLFLLRNMLLVKFLRVSRHVCEGLKANLTLQSLNLAHSKSPLKPLGSKSVHECFDVVNMHCFAGRPLTGRHCVVLMQRT